MPLISVIVPVYKVEQYLHRCVDSILCQSFSDFEVILVDDGSPDNCGAICDEYAQKDTRVTVIHQKNEGLSGARNTGIDWAFAHSDSQWLFFVDSDDFIHPESLRVLLDAAQTHGTDISIGGFVRTAGTFPADMVYSTPASPRNTREFFMNHNLEAIVAWGKLYQKDLFQDVRYPVGKIHEDEFTTYKLLFQCQNVSVTLAPLYGYFINNEGITGACWTPNRLHALEAFQERLRFFRGMGDKELCRYTIRVYANLISRNYTQANDYPQARTALKKQLRRTLLRHPKLFSFRKDSWFYSIAFPRIYNLLR